MTIGARDTKFLNIVMPVAWVVLAADAVISFTEGRLASALVSAGLLFVLLSGMIGPAGLRIVEPEKDVMLGKLLSITTLIGLLTMATGLMVRAMTWLGR